MPTKVAALRGSFWREELDASLIVADGGELQLRAGLAVDRVVYAVELAEQLNLVVGGPLVRGSLEALADEVVGHLLDAVIVRATDVEERIAHRLELRAVAFL